MVLSALQERTKKDYVGYQKRRGARGGGESWTGLVEDLKSEITAFTVLKHHLGCTRTPPKSAAERPANHAKTQRRKITVGLLALNRYAMSSLLLLCFHFLPSLQCKCQGGEKKQEVKPN